MATVGTLDPDQWSILMLVAGLIVFLVGYLIVIKS